MNWNVLDTVYIAAGERIVECILQQKDIFDGRFLVKEKTNTNQYIVDLNDMFKTPEECKQAFELKKEAEFNEFAANFGSVEAIIAHFLCKEMNSFNHNPTEIAAAISKASEHLHVDMWSYMEEYTKLYDAAKEKEIRQTIEDDMST